MKNRGLLGGFEYRTFMKKVDGIQDIWGIYSDEIKWDTE